MSKLSRVASALSFAHLTGFGSIKGKPTSAEDDEEKERKDARADEDQDDDKDDKRSRKAKGSKAGEDADDDRDDDDEHAEEDDKDDDEDDKKSRRAKGKSASDDDADAEDDEDEMHGKSAAASARRRERARCAAIFASRAAANNPVLAANLAFNTSMTRQEALNVLRDTPAGSSTAASRSAKNPRLGAGGEEAPGRESMIASRWDRAMSKVRGK